MSELTVEGAGNYHLQKIRKRPELREAQIGFNVVHDVKRMWGTLRPIRNLPISFTKGNITDNEGYIFPQGRILGKYDRQLDEGTGLKYQSTPNKLGISNIDTGEFNAYIDVNGVPQVVSFNDSDWGNHEDVTGLVGPMNGMIADMQDYYSEIDAGYGAVNPVTGDALVSAYCSTNVASSLRALGDPSTSTFELTGVAVEDTMRETRSGNYQYKRNTEAFAVAKTGYLTVPFIIADGGSNSLGVMDATPAAWTYVNWAGSEQRKVSADQTILFVESNEMLRTGNVVKIDGWGNPALSSSTDYNLEFGTLVDFTYSVRLPYAEWTNTYPEMEVGGTGTAGIAADIFYAARKCTANAGKSVADLATVIENSNLFGYATIYFDIP